MRYLILPFSVFKLHIKEDTNLAIIFSHFLMFGPSHQFSHHFQSFSFVCPSLIQPLSNTSFLSSTLEVHSIGPICGPPLKHTLTLFALCFQQSASLIISTYLHRTKYPIKGLRTFFTLLHNCSLTIHEDRITYNFLW